jgi:hypothetical protein
VTRSPGFRMILGAAGATSGNGKERPGDGWHGQPAIRRFPCSGG